MAWRHLKLGEELCQNTGITSKILALFQNTMNKIHLCSSTMFDLCTVLENAKV